MGSLVRPLPRGQYDVVGDVHGEYGALLSLLEALEYNGNGDHPQGRTLVFVGDLIDRGPDSVAVVRLVRRLVERRRAFCVLGNHEVNVLRGKQNEGSKWLYGRVEVMSGAQGRTTYQTPADPETREEILAFLSTLPLVLEGSDLRVVHAAWDDWAVDSVRPFSSVTRAHDEFRARCEQRAAAVEDHDERELILQNENPVNVIASGYEERAEKQFFAGGKWRTLQRCRWWERYPAAEPLVVFGHYWRATKKSVDPDGEAVFDGVEPFAALPTKAEGASNAMCVDYSVGRRYRERAAHRERGSLNTALVALRLPEGELIVEDGEVHQIASLRHVGAPTTSAAGAEPAAALERAPSEQ